MPINVSARPLATPLPRPAAKPAAAASSLAPAAVRAKSAPAAPHESFWGKLKDVLNAISPFSWLL